MAPSPAPVEAQAAPTVTGAQDDGPAVDSRLVPDLMPPPGDPPDCPFLLLPACCRAQNSVYSMGPFLAVPEPIGRQPLAENVPPQWG